MAEKVTVTEFEYVDKAFGLNIDETFENIDPTYMPARLKTFIEQGRNKRIYIEGIEKLGAKAFMAMIEKRSTEKRMVPTPLIAIHRETGTTTDQFDHYDKIIQYAAIAEAFHAQILPKTFSYTIKIIGRKEHRDLLETMTVLIDARLRNGNDVIYAPHIARWNDSEGAPQKKEINNYIQFSKTDIDNPAWTPTFEGGYMTLEKGQEVLTHAIVSSIITPSIIDFNFLGVESL